MMMVQTSIQTYLREHPETTPENLIRIVNEGIKHNLLQMKEEKYMDITVFSSNKDGNASFYGLQQDILIYKGCNASLIRTG